MNTTPETAVDTSAALWTTGDAVKDRIRKRLETQVEAKKVRSYLIFDNKYLGKLYCAEFEAEQFAASDSYYYCLVTDKDEVEIFETDEGMIRTLAERMETRGSLFHKLGNFTISDLLAFVIALVLAVCMIIEAQRGAYSKEVIGLLGIIVGYLFGKGKS
jgi:hypothetical protein